MRFAPPKSAPAGPRKSTRDTEENALWSSALSGWTIKPESHDVTLLKECVSDVPKRCSSATDRYSSSEPLIVNFRRLTNRQYNRQTNTQIINSSEKGSIGVRSSSKDSGVDGLTDSGVDSMDSVVDSIDSVGSSDTKIKPEEEDEFSDISESDGGSLPSEDDLLEEDLIAVDSSVLAAESAVDHILVGESAVDHVSAGEHVLDHVTPRSSHTLIDDVPPSTSLQNLAYLDHTGELTTHISRTSLESNAFKPRNQRKVRKEVVREHKVPTSVTPEKPDVSTPPRQQPWSRTRKLERHSTSPSVCSYTDMLHANRPRPDKRRSSLGFKSSCSIPSFSTPSQALLLIGMQPDKPARCGVPPQTRQRKAAPHKPPLIRRSRENNAAFELPALTVNGAGDLVIRKKHIITG